MGEPIIDSDEDDFEGGNNQIQRKDDIDLEDEDKIGEIVDDADVEIIGGVRMTMTLQQRTNFFVSELKSCADSSF